MSDGDDSQKTEEPTSKRLEDAYKEGNVPYSREVASALIVGAALLAFGAFSDLSVGRLGAALLPYLERPEQFFTEGASRDLTDPLWDLAGAALLAVAPLCVLLVVSGVASGALQQTITFTAKRLEPKFSKVSPLAGLGRIFSMNSLVEFLKGTVKMIVIAWSCWLVVEPVLPRAAAMIELDPVALPLLLRDNAVAVLIAVAVASAVIAGIDVGWQRYSWRKKLKMSLQEIRDEHKQSEGDPHVKQKIRAIRLQKSRSRMMQEIPKASVVVTNPTHYAVAIKYDETMAAPKVVAKGVDHIAAKIREKAAEHNVPIVPDPPLARARYAQVELDQEIPVEHWKAVAKIIGYVMARKNGKRPVTPPPASKPRGPTLKSPGR